MSVVGGGQYSEWSLLGRSVRGRTLGRGMRKMRGRGMVDVCLVCVGVQVYLRQMKTRKGCTVENYNGGCAGVGLKPEAV